MDVYGLTLAGSSGVNGDMYGVFEGGRVVALADGASGAVDKVEAAAECINTVRKCPFCGSGKTSEEYIKYIITNANDALIEKSRARGRLLFGTFSLLVVDKDELTAAAIGDSPVFLLRDGKVERIVKPKRRYAGLVDCGLMTEDECERYIRSLPSMMWSIFDNFIPMVIPEYALKKYKIFNGDCFFLCTDGISDIVSPEEFSTYFDSNATLKQACEMIIEEVKKRCEGKHRDDATIIAIRF